MREQLTCPQCGAPINGTVCQYCGAVFYDFATLDFHTPTYIKIKHDNMFNVFRAILTNFTIEMHNDAAYLYADNSVVASALINTDATLDLSMRLVKDDKGVYLCRKEML